jgi:EF hand domain-containing protein
MKTKYLFAGPGLLALLGPVALAQPSRVAEQGQDCRIVRSIEAESDGMLVAQEQSGDTDAQPAASDEQGGGRPRGGPERLIRLADQDRDGTVTADEWAQFLKAVDPNGKGVVDRDALHALIQQRFAKDGGGEGRHGNWRGGDPSGAPEVTIDALQAAFKQLDKNGDGILQSDEMPRRMGRHGQDKDHDKG